MVKTRICKRCRQVVEPGHACKAVKKQKTARDGYGRKWQRFRERLIRKRSQVGTFKCAMCKKAFGAESPHADHKIPVHDESDPLFYDEANIQFLHPSCHAIKTQGDVKQGLTR